MHTILDRNLASPPNAVLDQEAAAKKLLSEEQERIIPDECGDGLWDKVLKQEDLAASARLSVAYSRDANEKK